MYEYTFRRIDLDLSGKLKEDHQDVIRDFAKEGWRLVQVFSPQGSSRGNSPAYVELIFEREPAAAIPSKADVPLENEQLSYALDVQPDNSSIFKLSSDINLQDLISAVSKLKEDGLLTDQEIQDLVEQIKNLDIKKRMYGIRREEYQKEIQSIADKIQDLIDEKMA